LRGGSWHYYQGSARCAARHNLVPDDRRNLSGFRVVVSPSGVEL
jgi:formylglycine-generating enzyme required for sulfatase activity